MFSYIYMKILESAPRRYDTGISLLSLGRINKVKERIAREFIEEGDKVLDIGCGTGTLAVMMAEKGAMVQGFDASKEMLKVAREKIASRGLKDKVELKQFGVAEMDSLPAGGFDKVVATLVFSELSGDEQDFALREAYRVLKEDGLLIIGDEATPEIDTCCLNCLVISAVKKAIYHLIRVPLLVVTFIVTQTTTKPVKNLGDRLAKAGFEVQLAERDFLGAFELLVSRKRQPLQI